MTPLRRRMIEDMQVRNLSLHTQRAYLQQISLFSRHFGKSPELMGPEDIRAYQLHLARDRRLAASSILVAVSAIRFLHKITLKRTWDVEEVIPTCRKPQKLPAVLSQDEVARFLGALDNLKHRVILTICYAAGLRISEAVSLRLSSIDSQRMVIRVDHLGMINVLAGREVVREFIQRDCTPSALATEAARLLDDGAYRDAQVRSLTEVVATLGPGGAARRTAEAILPWLQKAEQTQKTDDRGQKPKRDR